MPVNLNEIATNRAVFIVKYGYQTIILLSENQPLKAESRYNAMKVQVSDIPASNQLLSEKQTL